MTDTDDTDTLTVLALDDYQNVAQSYGPWERLGDSLILDVERSHIAGDDELVARVGGANVLLAVRERTPMSRARLGRLPNLRLIVSKGMANASIDLEAASELGIAVCGTSRIGSPTLELTWGLILGLARKVCAEDREMRRGGWQHTLGTELAGARLGVVGLGTLGSQVAAVGRAFGMDVVAWSENLDEARATELSVKLVTKEELFRTSDVISVHLRLSPRTVGLIGPTELAWMRNDAYLINTSRGPIVDEAAMIDTLRSGRIAGAGLDVFDVEPLPSEHPLRTLPNVLLTPHLGFVTERGMRAFYEESVDAIESWRSGSPLRVLNPAYSLNL